MLSTEQLYIKALKQHMVEWRKQWVQNGWTEDRLRKVMQEFVSNEKLYAEIVRISLLMSDDVGNEGDVLGMIESTMEMIESLTRQFNLDVPVAWRYLMDSVIYGTDADRMRIYYDIAYVKSNIRQIQGNSPNTDLTAQGGKIIQKAEMQSLLLQMQSL
jgi:hypothetical protein